MSLSFYDTFRGHVEPFTPADPERITVYCCGPTVYAPPHIGNARAALTADLVVRLLKDRYGAEKVIFARNFTDIDDKIIAAAKDEGVPIDVVTARATAAYLEGLDGLFCLRPDVAPRATAHIDSMQALIGSLLERGHAYGAEGHILFDTQSFPAYGQLSRLDREAILAGARVEIAPYKRDAADFVLWKPSPAEVPGWPVPASWPIDGEGRPGWHIECSAMIASVLGPSIDIHLGGQDLRFPHHENEIAQSCCGTDTGETPLARYWLHNGMLRFGGEKMSKSRGNIETPQDLLAAWPGEAIRLALMSAQYRQPLDWSNELLAGSKAQLDRFYRVVPDGPAKAAMPDWVMAALEDDLNTPKALAMMHELREAAGRGDIEAAHGLKAAGAFLGFFRQTADEWFRGATADGPTESDIDAQIAARQAAKTAKNWAEADRIRDELGAQGIVLEDGPEGVTWRRR
ncbi:cysteinyl-tRNA synthetase [Parvularcula bermudensis HTCC2503]|uniref:Cysteine--tRNA ligase n=1 Tax=Parvularcula bermudensis (strain ATCC BAA-594 / HTCC2503 / KCTC 12087) TaxID=314260 RepID=E0TBM9_PARBH|nr:cysteine--tRNA ligase [Parvularcula bermudensis]ADM08404.1 cysteinyl-tRNA synthetase [Parvularcula bermudensis HTCC2503]